MKKETLRTVNIRQSFILTTALFWMLVGCVNMEPTSNETREIVTSSSELVNEVATPVTSPAVDTVSPSATPFVLPTATLEPTQTATVEPTKTTVPTPIPTSTALPLPSLTPLPTIPSEQRDQLYDELMTTNNGCQLPCWWGLEMGKSSMEELLQLYAQFDPAIVIQEHSGLTFVTIVFVEFVDPEITDDFILQTRHMFTFLDGILIKAEIQAGKYEESTTPGYVTIQGYTNFSPVSMMEQFGQPSEVWLWTIPEPYQGLLPASFRFYFPEQGILFAYREQARNNKENVEVCFDGDGGIILLLWNPDIWNPDGSKGFVERANESSELTVEGYQPISEVSNWDEETLYTTLLNPSSTECLQTPSELWVSP